MLRATYPGVYIDEIPAGQRPIESAGTSTPVFVGEAETGPANQIVRTSSWPQYVQHFGGFNVIEGTYLPHSVFQFFNNGGRSCYVLKLDRGANDTPPSIELGDLAPLDRLTDFSLLVLPGRPDRFESGLAYCENRKLRDIFLISDTPHTSNFDGTIDSVLRQSEPATTQPALAAQRSDLAAFYFPWVRMRDPLDVTNNRTILVPPSGFVAGIYARTDAQRGVWKSPAGLSASLRGAVGLQYRLTDDENGNLNRVGINVLRQFETGGIVVWGARSRSTDPRLRYLAARRTQAMIQRTLYDALQFAVFEPNDHRLWTSLKNEVGAYMDSLFRAGAFQGETKSQAYYVACDLDVTMTQADIDGGIVVVEVGFAPLKPAEFVVVRVQQALRQS